MPMLLIVPREESGAELTGIDEGSKATGELRSILQSPKMTLNEGIVVGTIGSAQRLGDAQISQ